MSDDPRAITEAKEFEHYFPRFTDEQVAVSVGAHGVKVSVWGAKRNGIGLGDIFVLALNGPEGTVGPVALNRTTAVALRELLWQQGF